ncbi:MAG: glycerol-3-phosphate 1-O-acyltransferase PlsY [Bacteroidota bacterium]
MLTLLTTLLLSYLLGSIPSSIIAGKLHGIDIRQHGSGNAGATNTFRVLGSKVGAAVMLFDMFKGFAATRFLSQIRIDGMLVVGDATMSAPFLMVLCGLMAMFGHIWTVFAGFKGGKGVATGGGMLLGLVPTAVLIALVLFSIIVYATRYVSLGSILATASIPVVLVVQHFIVGDLVALPIFVFCALVPFFIAFTHRANIQRLLAGTESRIGRPKTA